VYLLWVVLLLAFLSSLLALLVRLSNIRWEEKFSYVLATGINLLVMRFQSPVDVAPDVDQILLKKLVST